MQPGRPKLRIKKPKIIYQMIATVISSGGTVTWTARGVPDLGALGAPVAAALLTDVRVASYKVLEQSA